MSTAETKESPMSFAEAYAARTPRTQTLFERAKRTVPGGAGSTARLPRNGWRPYPIFMADGTGSRLTDVDGNNYIDYLLGLGPMILGHRHPVVTDAVAQAISDYGTCFGSALRTRDRSRREGGRRGARHRAGAVHQLRVGGRRDRRSAGPRHHGTATDRPLRGPLSRLAGHGVLVEPRRSGTRRTCRSSAPRRDGTRRTQPNSRARWWY